MRRFFTSDIHFGHANVIDYCDRPYNSVEEMDEAIIAQWNSQVSSEDIVYFLGDFGVNEKKILEGALVKRCNGIKIIKAFGNHDKGFKEGHKGYALDLQPYLDAGWSEVHVQSTLVLKNGLEVMCTHLPPSNEYDKRYIDFKVKKDPSKIYLHGHLHSNYTKKDNMIDVAFDRNLTLMSEDELISIIEDERTYIPSRLTQKYKTNNLLLEPFEAEIKKKYVQKSIRDNLVLFNYTEKCTYDGAWNEVTANSRGIIFNRNTGDLVAYPFKKFWNYSELQRTTGEDEENEMDKARKILFDSVRDNTPFDVYHKEDGSLGIIYHHNDKWNVATRGSFSSDQARRAEEILKRYDMSSCNTDLTLLVEIIYPENKIVVDYKGEEKLVLLAANHRVKAVEVSRSFLEKTAEMTGMPIVEKYNYTLDQMLELQKTLPKDHEGFIVRFENGLRVKLKGAEYLRIHKLISQVSPLAFWEGMNNGKVRADFLIELPEEYRDEADVIVFKLENNYQLVKNTAQQQFIDCMANIYDEMDHVGKTFEEMNLRKEIGLRMKNYSYGYTFFSFFDLKREALDKQIMAKIRPTGNELL